LPLKGLIADSPYGEPFSELDSTLGLTFEPQKGKTCKHLVGLKPFWSILV